jgi:NADPH:quinone reductase-like Zn-dependent oxidoreductase
LKPAGTEQRPSLAPGNWEMMRAIVQDHYGDDPERVLQLVEIARPSIGGDEVLVRVEAASIDMGTWHCMTGMPYAMRLAGFGVRSPKALNPGRALAGSVEWVGKNVTGFAVGDAVYGTCDGSFAEYVRVEAKKLAAKPAKLSFEQAAAAPISGVTALQALRKAQVQSGQRVLIVGASGAWGRSRCRSPRPSGPRSPACAALRRWTSSELSAPTT